MKHILPIILTSLAAPLLCHAAEPASSRLASGHWVKVRVDSAAVYAFTPDDLRQMGFSDPTKVNVFGYKPTVLLTHNPQAIPADVTPMASINLQGKLVFYAPSNVDHGTDIWHSDALTPKEAEHKRHMFSRGATYFLSDIPCDTPPMAETTPPQSSDGAATTHTALVYHEQDLYNSEYCGTHITGEAIKTKEGTLTFPLTLCKVANGGKAMLVTYSDHFGQSMAGHTLAVTYPNGFLSDNPVPEKPQELASFQSYGTMRTLQPVIVPQTPGRATYQLKFGINPNAASFSKTHIDFWAFRYERDNDLQGESQMQMFFEHSASGKVALSGITDANAWQVWDVTDPQAPTHCVLQHEPGGNCLFTLAAVAPENSAREVVAFNPSATLPRPEVVGTIECQDLHAMPTPQMLIVTSRMLLDRAERFAQLHRKVQGLRVEVVDQQKIFNEYGSGNISPEAVRRFVTHLDSKAPGTLRSVLLLGAATANNAADIADNMPYVITSLNEDQEESRKVTRGFFSDAFFGNTQPLPTTAVWLGRPVYYSAIGRERTVNVGRIPFTNPRDIDTYYDKVERYLTGVPTDASPANFILTSDFEGNADKEMHFNDAEVTFKPYTSNSDYTLTRAHANFYSYNNVDRIRRYTHAQLKQGASLFIYYGHGARDQIGGSTGYNKYLMTMPEAKTLDNPGTMPHAFIGSCNTGAMDVDPNNITSAMLLAPNGGMISVISSTREVYQSHNRVLGAALLKYYEQAADGTTIGTIYRQAQNEALRIGEAIRDGIVNHYCYNLFGDPELPIRKPTHAVTGLTLNSGGTQLNINGDNTLSGQIASLNDSTPDTSFQGSVVINIYNPSENLQQWLARGAKGTARITVDHTLLQQVHAQVKDGRFTARFTGTAPSVTSADNQRIQVYACSDDGKGIALGSLSGLNSALQTAKDETPADNDVRILSFAEEINGNRCRITATISAPDGLPLGNPIATALHFQIDGASVNGASRSLKSLGNGLYTFEHLTDNITHGLHTASLSVAGNGSATAHADIEFIHNPSPTVALTATVDGNALTLNVDNGDPMASHAIIIETLDGTLVRHIDDATLPTTITDLPHGNYRVFTQHASPIGYSSSPKKVVKL